MKEDLYLDIIPKIRVYEKKLINDLGYNKLIDSQNLNEMFRFLSETSYSENIVGDVNSENYELALSGEFGKLFNMLEEIFGNNRLTDLFLRKYKYNNLKVMLKAKFLNVDLDSSLFNVSNFDNELIYSCIKTENYNGIPNDISRLVKEISEEFNEYKDPQKIDILIDKDMFKKLIDDSKVIDDDFLRGYISVLIDVYNIKSLFRLKKLDIDGNFFYMIIVPGGNIPLKTLMHIFSEPVENILNRFSSMSIYKYIKFGLENYVNHSDLSILDRELDNYVIEYLEDAKIITFGLAPIIGYINAKENEIRNIRIILVGKINGINPKFIRERLRKSYV